MKNFRRFRNRPATSNVLILVAIDGGTLYSPRTNGFEKVMTNAFASNVQKEINKYRINQVLESEPEVLSETFASYSAITVECAKEDAAICLKCISDALFFGEIAPAEADSYVYTVQTQKRLYNASAVNQLYYQGIRFLYEDKAYRAAFDSENDILQDTQYADILAAYPQFLDAALNSPTKSRAWAPPPKRVMTLPPVCSPSPSKATTSAPMRKARPTTPCALQPAE